jgi:hypothetical protein
MDMHRLSFLCIMRVIGIHAADQAQNSACSYPFVYRVKRQADFGVFFSAYMMIPAKTMKEYD